MKWITLFNKIGRQPMKRMNTQPVYALLENPKTHRMEKVYLDLNFSQCGDPYLIRQKKSERR